jgi:hypothetical protein
MREAEVMNNSEIFQTPRRDANGSDIAVPETAAHLAAEVAGLGHGILHWAGACSRRPLSGRDV